jgi:uncharacterized lipoprotein
MFIKCLILAFSVLLISGCSAKKIEPPAFKAYEGALEAARQTEERNSDFETVLMEE